MGWMQRGESYAFLSNKWTEEHIHKKHAARHHDKFGTIMRKVVEQAFCQDWNKMKENVIVEEVQFQANKDGFRDLKKSFRLCSTTWASAGVDL